MRALPDHHPATLQRLARKLFDAVCKTHRNFPTVGSTLLMNHSTKAVYEAHYLSVGSPRDEFVDVAKLLNEILSDYNEILIVLREPCFRFEQ